VALDRMDISLSLSQFLVDSPYGSPSPSSSHLLAYEALARGELHNSWPCYTPTTATPEDSLPEGLRRPNPPCTTTFYASTSLPGSALVACIIRHHICAYLLTLCIQKNLRIYVCVHMHICTVWIKLALRRSIYVRS